MNAYDKRASLEIYFDIFAREYKNRFLNSNLKMMGLIFLENVIVKCRKVFENTFLARFMISTIFFSTYEVRL